MKFPQRFLWIAFIVLGSVTTTMAQESNSKKMKVEVWSDVVCPFCYIGKAHFDNAMAQFEQRENIDFEWKSFQLDPTVVTNPDLSLYEHLAASKGISVDQARSMGSHAAQMASIAGITMDFEHAVVANSFHAHRLIHFAKTKGLQQEMKSRLFKAYFEEGKNIDDKTVLNALAVEIGLDQKAAQTVLDSDQYADDVSNDILESRQLGVRGVPFFVINRKYAVSGAQPTAAFLDALQKAFAEWAKEQPAVELQVSEGPSCEPDKACD